VSVVDEAIGVISVRVGAPVSAGVTLLEALEAELVPTELVAVTVNVYEIPLVNPETTSGELVPVATIPPGDDVAVYPVIVAPPSDTGAVNETTAC
jgi:hypothetical protein